jgi:hypothetical protein
MNQAAWMSCLLLIFLGFEARALDHRLPLPCDLPQCYGTPFDVDWPATVAVGRLVLDVEPALRIGLPGVPEHVVHDGHTLSLKFPGSLVILQVFTGQGLGLVDSDDRDSDVNLFDFLRLSFESTPEDEPSGSEPVDLRLFRHAMLHKGMQDFEGGQLLRMRRGDLLAYLLWQAPRPDGEVLSYTVFVAREGAPYGFLGIRFEGMTGEEVDIYLSSLTARGYGEPR